MSKIIFYEKPGCSGNAQQKQWLRDAGHTLDVRDLLTEPWTRERLLGFFGALPVSEWFNRAAPAVRQGRIDPETLDADASLALMLSEPLLIRRPLMQDEDGRCMAGFDIARVDAWIGLAYPRQLPARTEGCIAADDGCPVQYESITH